MEARTSTGQVSLVLLVTFFLVTILAQEGELGEHKVGYGKENRQ